MIGMQRALEAEGKNYRAFEILNLGKYQRQHYIGIDSSHSLGMTNKNVGMTQDSSVASHRRNDKGAVISTPFVISTKGRNLNRQEQQRLMIAEKEAAFVDLILRAYRAERTDGFARFHGKRAGRL